MCIKDGFLFIVQSQNVWWNVFDNLIMKVNIPNH